jgi:ceramide glucosyltransferase
VSILKPLKGLDSGLEENLRSFFEMEYAPGYELLLCVGDELDPARAVAESMIARYPAVKARLLVGERQGVKNPKVANIAQAFDEASYDVVLISDSNVRVTPEYLQELVPHLGENVGMVSAAVGGYSPHTLGGALEALALNTFYTRWMFLTSSLGSPCVVGKCMLFRKSVLSRFGGIAALADFLAEDSMAGFAVKQLGLAVKLAPFGAPQHIGQYGVQDYWKRHVRWGRIRKAHAPLAFALEFLTGALAPGILGAWSASHLFAVDAMPFFMAHMGVWFIQDVLLLTALGTEPGGGLPGQWVLREITALAQWVQTALGRTVHWRGGKYRLSAGGLLDKT